MRKFMLALGPLFLIACDKGPVEPQPAVAPTFAATAGWYEDVVTYPEGDRFFYIPCIDDRVDEIGTIYRRRHDVIQDDGDAAIKWIIWPGDDYVVRGPKTGDWHPVSGAHNMVTITINAAQHQTLARRFVLQNAATGAVLDWPLVFVIVSNAAGDLTVEMAHGRCSVR